MSQTDFMEKVKGLEKKYGIESLDIHPKIPYIMFTPSYHVWRGLLAEEIVDDIRENSKSVLSVGSGTALIEKLLVNEFGIGQEQIVLSDKNEELLEPEGLEYHIFDMLGSWPDFGRDFDYIMFPQSFGVVIRGVVHNSQLSIRGNREEHYKLVMNLSTRIVGNALKHTKCGGQIRITDNHHLAEVEIQEEFCKYLATEHPGSDFIWDEQFPSLIVIKK